MSESTFLGQFFQSPIPFFLLKALDFSFKAQAYRLNADESQSFAKLYPLLSLMVFLVALSIPDFFLSVSLGIPFINYIFSFDKFVLAVLIWYMTFLCPRDFYYRMLNEKTIKIVGSVFVEINRYLVFSNVTNTALLTSKRGFFSTMLIPWIYSSAYLMAIHPLDQIMRGGLVINHEAKKPQLPTVVTFFYAFFTLIALILQQSTHPLFAQFRKISLESIHMSVLVSAIFLGIFRIATGWDPLTNIFGFSSPSIKIKTKKREVKVETPTSFSREIEGEEAVSPGSQKSFRVTRSKRRSSRVNAL